MKYSYFPVLAALAFAFGAQAALVRGDIPRHCVKSHTAAMPQRQKKAASAKPSPRRVEDASLANHTWTSIGTGRFTDDIITFCFEVPTYTYDVEVQQATDMPTLYRIVNPLQNHPEKAEMEAAEGIFPTDKDYYIYFDVTDPDFVKIPRAEFGYEDSDGKAEVVSLTADYEGLGYTYDDAMQHAGAMRDKIITFPNEASLRIFQGSHMYYGDDSGALKLVLPGGTDYSVQFDNRDGFCPGEDGCYHVAINTGATVPTVRYGIFDSYEDEHVMQLINGGSECQPGATVSLDLSTCPERRAYLIAITLNADGEFQDGLYTVLYNPADNSEKWQYYCNADFTDGLLSPYLYTEPQTVEVEVQQYTEKPGYFRIKNPYAGLAHDYMQDPGHSHGHYIYIDASEPENVIMQESPVGVYGDEYGEILVGSDYWNLIETYGREFADEYGITSGGLLADNTITFNASASLTIYPTLYADWFETNVKEDGSAGDFALVLKNPGVGIDGISAPSAEARYYNLQGIRVDNPQHGLYIERRGTRTRKVLLP